MDEGRDRLFDVVLDEASLAPASPNAEHERRVALFDLKEANVFAVKGEARGPYMLLLAQSDGRLVFDVSTEGGERVCVFQLPMNSMRRFVKDYALICES